METWMVRFEAKREESYRQLLQKVKASSQPHTILGIRMGIVRSQAKQLVHQMSYKEAVTKIYPLALRCYEYKLLFGLLGADLVSSETEVADLLKRLFYLCDGWAVPDLYKSLLGKLVPKYATIILASVANEQKSSNPSARRLTAVVQIDLLKKGITTPTSSLRHLIALQEDPEYLVQMGVAWALSEIEPSLAPGLIAEASTPDLLLTNTTVLRYYRQKLRDSTRYPLGKRERSSK